MNPGNATLGWGGRGETASICPLSKIHPVDALLSGPTFKFETASTGCEYNYLQL